MKTRSTKETRGFTIIEVMIVLAIAGLILAIVLLAVPALQRSQRNNARRSDAVHVAGLASDYISNHGGIPPPNGAFTTTNEQCSQLVGAAGTTCNVTVANNGTTWGTLTVAVIQTGQNCNTSTNALSAQTGAFSVTFGVEGPGAPATGTPICIPG